MATYRPIAVHIRNAEPYWTLVREPPFGSPWDSPHFISKHEADKEADRLTALDQETET